MIEATIAPFINKAFTITGTQYHYTVSGDPHGGLDISTNFYDKLYSMVNGKVIRRVLNDPSYGNYIIIQDSTTGVTWLYAHMDSITVFLNQNITLGQEVGIEGKTGNVTGIHVHLELQFLNPGDAWVWNIPYSDRPNIAEFMGLTNTQGLRAIYYGRRPIESKKDKKFKWVLFNKRIRKNRKILT